MRFAACIVSVLISAGLAYGQGAETYRLKIKSPHGEFYEELRVEHGSPAGYRIRYTDRTGEGSVNDFSPNHQPLLTEYLDKQGQKYLSMRFDHGQKKILSTGRFEKVYDLEEPAYDGSGAMFYILSRIRPIDGSDFAFNMVQGKEKRIIRMLFRKVGTESIVVGGRQINCVKYEMRAASRIISFFWPYPYHYWFSVETGQFLKYEGPVGHENNETIEVESSTRNQ